MKVVMESVTTNNLIVTTTNLIVLQVTGDKTCALVVLFGLLDAQQLLRPSHLLACQ
jgi:hypothetical protein